jgi:WhiB family redox-sensing transcriptional regulator
MSRPMALYRKPGGQPRFHNGDFTAADRDRSWMEDGACADHDPELWFPVSIAAEQTIKICLSCPVLRRCLDFAWDNRIQYGVWGGMSVEGRYQYKVHGMLPPGWSKIKSERVG